MQQKEKILIVDDEVLTLTVLGEYLSSAGYSYATAENGQIAWKLLTEDPQAYNLILVDRIMPGMDGMELLYRIKAHPALRHLPVIMLTGLAEKDEVVNAIKAGIYDFLYKPVEQELVLQVIQRALLPVD